MKIYIPGPSIQSIANKRPEIQKAIQEVTRLGHYPVPSYVACDQVKKVEDNEAYIKARIYALLQCDAILMLSDWGIGRIAGYEMQVAVWCKIPARRLEELKEAPLLNHCPKCGHAEEDHDGLGFCGPCDACGYCPHPNASYNSAGVWVCGVCSKPIGDMPTTFCGAIPDAVRQLGLRHSGQAGSPKPTEKKDIKRSVEAARHTPTCTEEPCVVVSKSSEVGQSETIGMSALAKGINAVMAEIAKVAQPAIINGLTTFARDAGIGIATLMRGPWYEGCEVDYTARPDICRGCYKGDQARRTINERSI
jgi:hypothetical protein